MGRIILVILTAVVLFATERACASDVRAEVRITATGAKVGSSQFGADRGAGQSGGQATDSDGRGGALVA